MADEIFARALADCLEAMRQGDAALEAFMERQGSRRAELEELMRLIDLIPQLPADTRPDAEFVERTRQWLAGRQDTAGSETGSWDPAPG